MNYKKNNYVQINLYIIFILIITGIFIFISGKNPKLEKYNNLHKNNTIEQNKHEEKKNEAVLSFNSLDIPFHPNLPPFKKYKYIYMYTIDVLSSAQNVEILIPIPNNEKEKQYISDFIITPKPSAFVKIKGNLTAKYEIPQLNQGQYNIIISGTAQVRTYNIKTAKKLNKNISPETDITKYLLPEKGIESNDPYIVQIANNITGVNREEIIENVYRYIQDNMSYRITDNLLSAKNALLQKTGKCGEYSAIMVALLRAKNIPARIAIGNIARENNSSHNWVEVYFPEYGWVTYDPTAAPTVIKIHAPNGKLIKIEKRYDVSHDDLNYIQSGINVFSPYFFRYTDEYKEATVSINQDISIVKIF